MTEPAPFEIWMAKVQLGMSSDPRPILIVDRSAYDDVGYFPISTKCYNPPCFPLTRDHPDFPATGLPRESYILDARLFETDAESLMRCMGKLTGELLEEFRTYAGL